MPQQFPSSVAAGWGPTERCDHSWSHLPTVLGLLLARGVFEPPTAHLPGQVSSPKVSSEVCCPPASSPSSYTWEGVRLGAAIAHQELGPAAWIRQGKLQPQVIFQHLFLPLKTSGGAAC